VHHQRFFFYRGAIVTALPHFLQVVEPSSPPEAAHES
jgi:hypothetical protein